MRYNFIGTIKLILSVWELKNRKLVIRGIMLSECRELFFGIGGISTFDMLEQRAGI